MITPETTERAEQAERAERERMEHERMERPPQHNGQTISGLLKHLRDELILLFRQELMLARSELTGKARYASRHLILIGVGAVVALCGLIVFLNGLSGAAAVALAAAGVSPTVAVWLGPVLLGLIVLGIGYAVLRMGQDRLKETTFVPEHTVQTLREDKNWAQQKIHRT